MSGDVMVLAGLDGLAEWLAQPRMLAYAAKEMDRLEASGLTEEEANEAFNADSVRHVAEFNRILREARMLVGGRPPPGGLN
jgi:hypothetical protein